MAESSRAYTLLVPEVSPTAVEKRLDLRGILKSFDQGPSEDWLLYSGAVALDWDLATIVARSYMIE